MEHEDRIEDWHLPTELGAKFLTKLSEAWSSEVAQGCPLTSKRVGCLRIPRGMALPSQIHAASQVGCEAPLARLTGYFTGSTPDGHRGPAHPLLTHG